MIKKRIRIFQGILLLFLSLVALSFPKEKNILKQLGLLKDIVLSKTQNTLEVKILFNLYTSHRQFELSNPNRIVVDLFNIEDIKASRYFEINDFGIQAIRVSMVKTDVARVVFGLKEKVPPYKIERIQSGLKVLFWLKEPNQLEREKVIIGESQREEPEVKGREEKEVELKAVLGSKNSKGLEKETKEATNKIKEKLGEKKRILGEAVAILNQIKEERMRQRKKFVRIETIGNYFQPTEEVLKDVYGNGMMFGTELNVGIWNFIEFWLAEKYFNKRAIEEDTGEEREINLIPLEAGLKFRLNKGDINPYFGVGAVYYRYKEISFSGEIKDKKIGFVGLAGFFFKIKLGLIFDIYAHYSYCLVTSGSSKFNVGGLHLGVGFGFEY